VSRRTALRRTFVRTGVVAVATLVLGMAATAGVPYWWCTPMARAQASRCCPRDVEPDVGGPRATAPDCCTKHRVAALPTSSTTATLGDLDAVVAPSLPDRALPDLAADALVDSRPLEARGPPRGARAPLYDLTRRYLA
jgi:hypothetical protein